MNEAIKERISALVDGELSEFEVRRVLEEIDSDPNLRDYWSKLHLAKNGLKDQSLSFLDRDVSKRVALELGKYAKKEESESVMWRSKFYLISIVTAGLVLFISLGLFTISNKVLGPDELFASEASQQIAEAIASPEAFKLLDKALTGLNATLQEMNSGNKGQIYANYKLPISGKTFMVSLSPISVSTQDFGKAKASKLTYLETKEGLFIITVSGNISPEKKSQILRNVNYYSN